jgi:hypothetical protein
MSILNPETSAKLGTLQVLDDAIAFRLGRLNMPCRDCTPEQKCADHAWDVDLVEGYKDTYADAFREACAGMDPEDIDQIMRRGDDMPPTVGVLSAAVLARLRELAADGPAVTRLDGRSVVIELDGRAVAEYPLATDGDDADRS